MATENYHEIIAWNKAQGDEEYLALAHKVWDGTPWILDVYEGRKNHGDGRSHEMRVWCAEKFGPEAWPMHDKPGGWQRSGFSINGWTWFGFDTEEKMKAFAEAWPNPEEVKGPDLGSVRSMHGTK